MSDWLADDWALNGDWEGLSGEFGISPIVLQMAGDQPFAITPWGAFGPGWITTAEALTEEGGVTLSGALFSSAPTFLAGSVLADQSLAGVVFSSAPTFLAGVVSLDDQFLTGVLFSTPPNFLAGTISQNQTLLGALFSVPPTFISGTVDLVDDQTLTGVLFSVAPLFLSGTLTAPLLTTGSGWGMPIGIT